MRQTRVQLVPRLQADICRGLEVGPGKASVVGTGENRVASQVPKVKQVVNELQVKNQKVTSSKGQ